MTHGYLDLDIISFHFFLCCMFADRITSKTLILALLHSDNVGQYLSIGILGNWTNILAISDSLFLPVVRTVFCNFICLIKWTLTTTQRANTTEPKND